MKKLLLLVFLFPVLYFGQSLEVYYKGTEGLSGFALKSKLHEIISQQIYSYKYTQVASLYAATDIDNYYEKDGSVLDIYSEIPNGADAYIYNLNQNISSANAEGQGWNKEHGMPQSNFYGIYPMYSDIHFLIPADARINQLRSNNPYGRTLGAANNCNSPNTTPCTASNGSKLGKSITPGFTGSVYEPIDEFKGDVARYLLYFITRYEGLLNSFNHQIAASPLDGTEERGFEEWYINMLKEWNTLDPVSSREIDRNNAIYAIEKIRNPFIDHPEWVNLIWDGTTDAVAPQVPVGLSVDKVGESFVALSWMPSSEADVIGYKVFVNGTEVKYSHTNSLVIDRLSPSTTYTISVKAYDKGYLLSADSNIVEVTTLDTDQLAKDLMITKYIEGTTSTTNGIYNTAIEITNLTGHDVDLGKYYLNMQSKSGTSYYFAEAYQLEGNLENGKSIVLIDPSANFSNYSPSQARFVTNSSALTFTGSQYVELSYGVKYLKTVSTNNYDMSFTTVDAVGIKNTSNSNGNVSLYRNTNVTDPNINFTMSEWTSHPMDYAEGLGTYLAEENIEKQNTAFAVYPNPTQNILKIKGKQMKSVPKIQILDLTGKMVLERELPFNQGNTIDVSALIPGVYWVKIDGFSQKFIKK